MLILIIFEILFNQHCIIINIMKSYHNTLLITIIHCYLITTIKYYTHITIYIQTISDLVSEFICYHITIILQTPQFYTLSLKVIYYITTKYLSTISIYPKLLYTQLLSNIPHNLNMSIYTIHQISLHYLTYILTHQSYLKRTIHWPFHLIQLIFLYIYILFVCLIYLLHYLLYQKSIIQSIYHPFFCWPYPQYYILFVLLQKTFQLICILQIFSQYYCVYHTQQLYIYINKNIYKIMFRKKQSQQKNEDLKPRILNFSNTKNNPESDSKNSIQLNQLNQQKHSNKQNVSPNYAYQLLLCQMQLQTFEPIRMQLITRLFQLYKKGIQFYNLRHDKRQEYFKKKLQNFNLHPFVLKVLQGDQNEKVDSFYKKKQLQRLVEINNKNTNTNANKMLRVIEQMDKKNSQKIQKNINNQLQQIKKRIQARKNPKISASTIDQNQVNIFQTPQKPIKNKKVASSFGVPQFRKQYQEQDDYGNQYFIEKYKEL